MGFVWQFTKDALPLWSTANLNKMGEQFIFAESLDAFKLTV